MLKNKTKFRIVLLLCVVIFMIGAVAGCYNPDSLTEKASNYIKNIFANEFKDEHLSNDDIVIKHYFGEFNGAHVAVVKGNYPAMPIPEIKYYFCPVKSSGEYPFKVYVFPYLPETISVYYDGEYYLLPDACELDLFNEGQMQRIQTIFSKIVNKEDIFLNKYVTLPT